jgi:hypothetical protein
MLRGSPTHNRLNHDVRLAAFVAPTTAIRKAHVCHERFLVSFLIIYLYIYLSIYLSIYRVYHSYSKAGCLHPFNFAHPRVAAAYNKRSLTGVKPHLGSRPFEGISRELCVGLGKHSNQPIHGRSQDTSTAVVQEDVLILPQWPTEDKRPIIHTD